MVDGLRGVSGLAGNFLVLELIEKLERGWRWQRCRDGQIRWGVDSLGLFWGFFFFGFVVFVFSLMR